MNTSTITFNEIERIKMYMNETLSYGSGSGQYTIDNNKIVTVNDNSTTKGTLDYFVNVQPLDVIEITADFYSISGMQPCIAVDGMSSGSGTLIQRATSIKRNEWETVTLKVIVPYDFEKMFRVVIGTWTVDTSVFKMRDISITTKTQNPISHGSDGETVIKTALLQKTANEWTVRSDTFASDNATITVLDEYTIQVNWVNPFISNRRPIAICHADGGDKFGIDPLPHGSQNEYTKIKFKDSSGSVVKLSSIPSTSYFDLVVFSK